MGGNHGRCRRQIGPPTSYAERWEWILKHGAPTYLDQVQQDPETGWVVSSPPALEAQRLEVQRVAQHLFKGAPTAGQKAKIVKTYVSHFPHLAFERDSWFWEPYWVARARQCPEDEKLLRAVASGIKARAPGWMPSKRAKAWWLVFARRYLAELKQIVEWKRLFHVARHSTNPMVAKLALSKLVKEIKHKTGYESSAEELIQNGLAVVRRRAVARKFDTPEIKVVRRRNVCKLKKAES